LVMKHPTWERPWANNNSNDEQETKDQPLSQKDTLDLHYDQYLQIREQRRLKEQKVRGSTVLSTDSRRD
jgi:hypothetical protein